MPKEQRPTIQSPLSLLIKPGALQQPCLPGLPAPVDKSRFSKAKVEYALKRAAGAVRRFVSRDGQPGHMLKTDAPQQNFSSTLAWSDGSDQKVVVSAELRGNIKMHQDGNSLVFQNDEGAVVRYTTSGGALGSASPLRRQVALEKEKDVPWYQKSAEAVGPSGTRIEAMPLLVRSIPERKDTTNGTQRVQFTVSPVGAEDIELQVDVYNDRRGVRGGNPRRISQVLDKKLWVGETILLTGHYHADVMTLKTSEENKTAKQFERRWIRLITVDLPPANPTS